MRESPQYPDLPPLTRDSVDPDPVRQFEAWFEEAQAAVALLPEAAALSTAAAGGRPSSRTVLLKSVSRKGFVFFTNYRSRKARELEQNPYAVLLFYWSVLHRQVAVSGTVDRVARQESVDYFRTRPRENQIGAHASPQSQVIASRSELDDRYARLAREYEGREIPCPDDWGGYRLVPATIEFWQGRSQRLHDRLLYTRRADRSWALDRLAP